MSKESTARPTERFPTFGLAPWSVVLPLAAVASLLLGLYADDGLLHHVGFCSSFKAAERRAWAEELRPLEGGEGFTGNRPDKASRWSSERTVQWVPLTPRWWLKCSTIR